MAKLYPTLWRTCRVLSGETRLHLLRLVVDRPGQTVSELAEQIKISLPRASQELRRLQSRGLIQAVRNGRYVRYGPVPDRLVPSARPLLQAMQETFRIFPAAEDAQIIRIATAFSHARRLKIARLLLKGPWPSAWLAESAGMSRNALHRHLRDFRAAGLVRWNGRMLSLVESPHPLAKSLLALLEENLAPKS